jgi:UV excision repair protein RAD23
MKISIKPVKGDTFEVDIDPEQNVKDLKVKIKELRPEFEPELTKAIYNGKIMADDQQIKEYNVQAGQFVVVMSTKPKAEPKAAPPAPTSMVQEQAASNVVQGAGSEAVIANLVGMGFEREQVERCLRAAFGNPDRAVEYLTNGLPDNLEPNAEGGDEPMPQAPSTGTPPPGGVTPFPVMPPPSSGTAPSGAVGDMLAELRNIPRFQELAQVISRNPAQLATILPALQQSHPQIAEAIRTNPEAFLQALAQAAAPQERLDPVQVMLRAVQGGGPGVALGVRPPGPTIRLTEEEAAAVGRLEALGYHRNNALQAYLACDKNEEAAANLLLSDPSMQDD